MSGAAPEVGMSEKRCRPRVPHHGVGANENDGGQMNAMARVLGGYDSVMLANIGYEHLFFLPDGTLETLLLPTSPRSRRGCRNQPA